jgi:hypothetical protein
MGLDLAALLESGQNADVTFKVEEETMRAHRIILTTRSPMFQGMLNSGMRQGTCLCCSAAFHLHRQLARGMTETAVATWMTETAVATWMGLFRNLLNAPLIQLICLPSTMPSCGCHSVI